MSFLSKTWSDSRLSHIVVIYDGQCRFCIASVNWVELKLACTSLAYQSADLAEYNLTEKECSEQVIVISENTTYKAAAAVAFLLGKRGNKVASSLITGSGKLGQYGYRWVASHRNSLLIRAMTVLLERAAR